MLKFLNSTRDARIQNVLNQIFALTHVRCSLTNLRGGKTREAITNLELYLDSLVNSLANDVEQCGTTEKSLLKWELKMVYGYRKGNEEQIDIYLHPELEERERIGLLQGRSRAQKILHQNSE